MSGSKSCSSLWSAVFLIMLVSLFIFAHQFIMFKASNKVVYPRQALLAQRSSAKHGIKHSIPVELWKVYRRCRAGVKLKAMLRAKRMKYKLSIPSIVMGNVNSLTNKCDELEALVRNQQVYWECGLMCFLESWLFRNG